MLPPDLASWPGHTPTAAVLGRVELHLDGAFGSDESFTLDVPTAEGEAGLAAGHLVVTDDEGTPVAELAVEAAGPADDADIMRLTGALLPLRHARGGPFRSLRLRPDQVRERLAGGAALAISLGRPLRRDEEDRLADGATAAWARLLLLACVGGVGPTGLPPEVLVQAIRASLPRLSTPHGDPLLVTLPLVPGDGDAVPAGVTDYVCRSGASLMDSGVLDADGWTAIATALEAGPDADQDALDRLVRPDVAAALRQWRPPRPHRGITVLFTGLSGSGKSTVARGVVEVLLERGRKVTLIDGDVARRLLSAGLTFSRDDRDRNIRRIGWVAAEITRHGGVAVCAPIAPYAATRAEVRQMVTVHGDLILVHVSTPLEECERRDRKGLYARARAGLLPAFTGISDPYEAPDDADLTIDTSTITVDQAVARVIGHLERGGWLSGR